MICTFFGHRDCSYVVETALTEAIKRQIERGVTEFFVGHEGNFDAITLSCLNKIKEEYKNIRVTVILAYLKEKGDFDFEAETMLPDGIETVPKKFAVDYRNRFMISKADCVIGYLTHTWGCASKYVALAKAKGKNVVLLPLTE